MRSKDKLQEKSSAVKGITAFSEVVDKACKELMDCQIKYTIQRIYEMEKSLYQLEQELDNFLSQGIRK